VRRVGITAFVVGSLISGTVFADWDQNPSFETLYTDAWTSYDPTVTANSFDFAFSGLESLKFDTPDFAEDPVSGGNLPSYTLVDSPHNNAIPGIDYTASGYYYVDQALVNHERLGLGIFWLKLNGGGTALEPSAIDPGDWTIVFGPELKGEGVELSGFPIGQETVGAWTQIQYAGTAPADAEFMQIALEVRGDGSAVYFDEISVIPEPASILLVGMGIAMVTLARRKSFASLKSS